MSRPGPISAMPCHQWKDAPPTIDTLYNHARQKNPREALAIYGRYLADKISDGQARFMLRRITRYG